MENQKKAYIAGVLTVYQRDMRPIYENIAKICTEHNIFAHVPHLAGTDPYVDPEVTPKDVWEKNYHEVTAANYVIAYVGQPSLGTGEELEMARASNIPIIAWSFNGEKVSRMVTGNPGVKEIITIDNEADLYNRINEILKSYEQ